MKAKHSPGPWEVHGSVVDELFYVHAANHICEMSNPVGFYCSPAERTANAVLIAAAPDLLAACEAALPLLDMLIPTTQGERKGSVRDLLVTAISKARGEA